MFIAWPLRHWRANWERRRAKAAQAALQSQISCSKGQSRVGEEKLLLANTAKKTLPVTAQNPATMVVPAKGLGRPAPGHPNHALQERGEVWPGTLVMAGACGCLWQEGLGVGQGRGAPGLVQQLYPGSREGEVVLGAAHGQTGS